MSQHIHCLVNDCHYWYSGNICRANEIIVTSDDFGDTQPDHIDATMAGQLEPTPAGSCMATCCKTYVPKNSEMADVDGVKTIT